MFTFYSGQREYRCAQVFFLLVMTAVLCERAAGQAKTQEKKSDEQRAAIAWVRDFSIVEPNAFGDERVWNRRYHFNVSLLPASPKFAQGSGFHWATRSRTGDLVSAFGTSASSSVTKDPVWVGGAGNWSNAAKWTGGVPTATTDAQIDGGNAIASPVTLDIGGAQVRNLTIDSDDSLNFNNGTFLTVNGNSIANAGKITLNSTGSGTELTIANPGLTLSGGGNITMSNNVANFIVGSGAGATLINQETIQGAGVIESLQLVNTGTINANASAGLTISPTNGIINSGTIEATGGTLSLSNAIANNTGGTISASGQNLVVTNSTINGGTVTLTGAADLQLSNSTIENGTLTNSATGTIEALSFTNNTLASTVSNPAGGLIKVDNGGVLNLQSGNYPTLGAVQLNSTANTTELVVTGGNVTLSGGSLTLSNNANNFIIGAASADTLNNQETIQGAGNIGNSQITLVNSGTINANGSAGMTINASGGATNTGTIEATGGALTLTNTTVNNAGGTISSSGQNLIVSSSTINGGTVTLTGAADLQLSNGTIQSGTVNNSSTGTIEALGFTTNTLGGTISNPAGGVVKVDNGGVLDLQNGNYASLGAVQVNSTGNATELVVKGSNVTLSGGSVTLSNNANNFIVGAAGTNTLTNQETIQGAGNIGNGQLTLVNSGTINANGSAGLKIQANGGITNTGTIEATGGTLTLISTTLNNAGGTISSNGQNLVVSSSTINGGTVTLTGAADLQLSNGTIQSGTVNNSSTGTIEALGFTTNTLGGTISNPAGGVIRADDGALLNLHTGTYTGAGNIQLNSTGNATDLQLVGGNVTLSGGSLTLSNNVNNFIFGALSSDTLTNQETIQGAGNIGNGRMTLVNSGTINANQAAGLTIQASGGAANTGTIEATGGTLTFSSTAVNNNGGTISSNGQNLAVNSSTINGGTVTLTGAATLKLSNSTIQGGTLTNSPTGTIEALSFTTDTLGDTFTNPAGGVVKVDNAAVLDLHSGTYTNAGNIQVNSTGNLTELVVKGSNVTLTGGGTVTLSNNANNVILGASAADILTNQETIQGAGNIGNGQMGLVNSGSGTILANQGTPLIIEPNFMGFNNQGTLSVSSGDLLHVSNAANGIFLNFLGNTLTGGTYNVSGTLEIDQLGNTGGEILTNAGNIILNGAASSFVDSASKDALAKLNTNAAGGAFTILGGRNYTTAGNFTNNGTLAVGSGSTFAIPTGFSLSNFSGTTLTGGTYNVTGTLQFPGANIATNAANITLTGGSAKILNSTTSGNALANFATNAASGSFTINGGANFTTLGAFANSGALTVGSGSTFNSTGNYTNTGNTTVQAGGTFNEKGTLSGAGTFTNGGTLEAMSGNTMDLKDNVANSGGTILATGAGSQVLLDGATISGGTLTNASGGALIGENSATLDGSTNAVTISSGSALQVNNGQTLQAKGTITDNGTLTLSSTGTTTKLLLTGNATLGGTGTLTLSNNANNLISATASTDVLTNAGTIQGAGNIGNGLMGLVNNNVILANQSTPLIINVSSAGFTNNGTLTVNTGNTLNITGAANSFLNFSSGTNTLTGGIYNVMGTLQFNNANIVTNAANITLNGASSLIVNQSSVNGLANFATNSATGSFSILGGRNFTTAGNFSNAGTLSIATGSTFTLGGTGNFTQTAGKTTDDGTLSAPGTVTLSGGSLFGKGSIASAVANGGTITPGDSSTSTGALGVTKTYTQNAGGALNIAIGGTTAGTTYDQLNVTGAATLNGTLNLTLVNGFVPMVGTIFDVVNSSAISGTFSTVNGTHINGSEHFVVTCDATDCDVTVMSGAMAPVRASSIGQRSYSASFGRIFKQSIWSGSQLPALRVLDLGTLRTTTLPTRSFARLQLGMGAVPSFRGASHMRITSEVFRPKTPSLSANAAYRTMPRFADRMTVRNFFRPGLNNVVRRGGSGAAGGYPMNGRALRHSSFENGVDLSSFLGMLRRHN